MKRLAGCIILTALLVGFAIYAKIYSQGEMAAISDLVNSAKDSYSAGNAEEAISAARQALGKWGDLAEQTLFVDCPEIDVEITITLARIEKYAQNSDDEIYPECAAALSLLDNYSDRQELTWVNVF